jgi:hypothetical protein
MKKNCLDYMHERLHANVIQNKLNNTTFIFFLTVKTKTALSMHFVDYIFRKKLITFLKQYMSTNLFYFTVSALK